MQRHFTSRHLAELNRSFHEDISQESWLWLLRDGLLTVDPPLITDALTSLDEEPTAFLDDVVDEVLIMGTDALVSESAALKYLTSVVDLLNYDPEFYRPLLHSSSLPLIRVNQPLDDLVKVLTRLDNEGAIPHKLLYETALILATRIAMSFPRIVSGKELVPIFMKILTDPSLLKEVSTALSNADPSQLDQQQQLLYDALINNRLLEVSFFELSLFLSKING